MSEGAVTAAKPLAAPRESDTRLWLTRLVLGLAILLAIRGLALLGNGTDLFFDEAQYWTWSLQPAFGYYSKPPLIAWLIHGATSICGHGESCIRLPSPLLHTATALLVFALARQLYDARTGALAGLAFATLPGVSLSAGLISTDVPLLFFWALALAAFTALPRTTSWWPALALGLALGLGLNAKYAMAWFVLCAGIYVAMTREGRPLARDLRLWTALALGIALLVPNIIWNSEHSFATVGHTADNAKWSGHLVNPGKFLEFFAAQFGVFGPILFAGLLVVTYRAWRQGVSQPADKLLLAFTWPVLAVIMVQALVSRAHANWAAVSYVAGTALVVAHMIRALDWRWLKTSFLVHGLILLVLAAATAMANRMALPLGLEPFERTLGWRNLAVKTRTMIDEARRANRPFAAVLTDDRAITAELLYYMRDEPTPVLAWRSGPRPQDHYELTRPYTGAPSGPILLVATRRDAEAIKTRFRDAEALAKTTYPAGRNAERRVEFYVLSGYEAHGRTP